MLEATRLMLASAGPDAMRDFERQLLPTLLKDPYFSEPITDEFYRREIEWFRGGQPGITDFLRQHRG